MVFQYNMIETLVFMMILIRINTISVSGQTLQSPAISQEFKNDKIAEGQYYYNYRTNENTRVQQTGEYIFDGEYVVRGLYSYLDKLTNKVYTVTYYADKYGYHPHISISTVPPATSPPAGAFVAPRIISTMMG